MPLDGWVQRNRGLNRTVGFTVQAMESGHKLRRTTPTDPDSTCETLTGEGPCGQKGSGGNGGRECRTASTELFPATSLLTEHTTHPVCNKPS